MKAEYKAQEIKETEEKLAKLKSEAKKKSD